LLLLGFGHFNGHVPVMRLTVVVDDAGLVTDVEAARPQDTPLGSEKGDVVEAVVPVELWKR
jgi:hypothetical protein